MDPEAWKIAPQEIERRSFEIIDQEAGPHDWAPDAWTVVRRLVHTSADFDYVRDTVISEGAIASGVAALRSGALLFTDTKMALNGINKGNLAPYGCEARCLVDDPRVVASAKEGGHTRSQVAVDVALNDSAGGGRPLIWVFGNAPTALLRLIERLKGEPGLARPSLVVGLPVGFVNAYESKKELTVSGLPYFITNLSRKGGSNVAAATINALAKLIAPGPPGGPA
ncbi:MAG: precorrin-8X methylmutase [Deltaproteobacteria bacterium]|jgi:precorrin-8X/cobalt-precorrin-8 methylmutase|nr:precorrin-8X methylmutase [Deltaproteobacteria bacterium]